MAILYNTQPVDINDLINIADGIQISNNSLQSTIQQHLQSLQQQNNSLHITIQGPTCLYAGQQECIVYQYNQQSIVEYIGSSDATTCVIVALYHRQTRYTVVAHMDNYKQLHSLIEVLNDNRQYNDDNNNDKIIDLHMVGSFHVTYGRHAQTITESTKLVKQILNTLNSIQQYKFNLITYIVGQLNKQYDTNTNIIQPLVRSLYINTCTGQPYTNVDIDNNARGPETPLRYCYMYSNHNHQLHRIYDNDKHTIVINPFSYQTYYSADILTKLIQVPSSIYCDYCSSSPLNETDIFVYDSKSAYLYMIQHNENNDVNDVVYGSLKHKLVYKRIENTNRWKLVDQ